MLFMKKKPINEHLRKKNALEFRKKKNFKLALNIFQSYVHESIKIETHFNSKFK